MFKLQSKITPFLWYDHQAGDAAAVSFELHGQPLIAFKRVARVMQAMMKMSKFDVAALQRAYDGG